MSPGKPKTMHGILKNSEIGLFKYKNIESVTKLRIRENGNIRSTSEPTYFISCGEFKIQRVFEPLLMSGGEGSIGAST